MTTPRKPAKANPASPVARPAPLVQRPRGGQAFARDDRPNRGGANAFAGNGFQNPGTEPVKRGHGA